MLGSFGHTPDLFCPQQISVALQLVLLRNLRNISQRHNVRGEPKALHYIPDTTANPACLVHLEDSSQGLLQSKVLDLRGGVLAPGARRLRACIIRHNLFCTGSSFDSLMKESRPQCHLLLSSWCSVLAKGVLSQNLDFHSRERHTEGPARGVETERERESERWRDMEREREGEMDMERESQRARERERERGRQTKPKRGKGTETEREGARVCEGSTAQGTESRTDLCMAWRDSDFQGHLDCWCP